MTALPAQRHGRSPRGISEPRIAPPLPAFSLAKEYEAAAKQLGIKPMPWQKIASRFLTARTGGRWTYREVAIVVARQNGKTTLLLPLILEELRMGRRIIHTAQNRTLPRETFVALAAAVAGSDDLVEVRYANGQELIRFRNGGRYTLVAPRPGVRGASADTVLLDEVREQPSFDLMAALKPTLTASRDPHIVYLSNAGSDDSLVLNDLQRRGTKGEGSLAYLEWSAAPGRAADDLQGWREANPSMGWTDIPIYEALLDHHVSLPAAVFETEHLCRWVVTMKPKVVDVEKWQRLEGELEGALRPVMSIAVDASQQRASACLAWQQVDGKLAVRLQADVTGEPVDLEALGEQLREMAIRAGVREVAYDSLTDDALAQYFKNAKPMSVRAFANACATFVSSIESRRIVWGDADAVGQDLAWTARRALAEGAWVAVKANEERPITAALAAIRAVQLASGPRPSAPVVR